MNWKPAFAVCGVFIGCCLGAFTLELAIRVDPGAGNLICFMQFSVVAFFGLIFTSKFFTVKTNIPLSEYILLVIMFFAANVINNHALSFNVSIPLVMIFQSGSLIANMVLGVIILNKSYDMWKYLSVLMITVGIFLCTIATGTDVKRSTHSEKDNFFWWTIGVGMLSTALFISARLGLYQEVLYKRRGKHVFEALFYTNILPLPAFLFMSTNISHHFQIALESEILNFQYFSVRIQIFYLMLNACAHYLCITCVFILTTECTSLTVTMVVTIRKFLSLLMSVFYFRHNFTLFHWTGTFLIAIGTIIFTEIYSNIRNKFYSENVDKFYLNKLDVKQSSLRETISRKFNFVPTHYKLIKTELDSENNESE